MLLADLLINEIWQLLEQFLPTANNFRRETTRGEQEKYSKKIFQQIIKKMNMCELTVQKEKQTFLSASLVEFDQRYSAYPTPTYPSDSVSVAKNSKDVTGKTKSARNFIYILIR